MFIPVIGDSTGLGPGSIQPGYPPLNCEPCFLSAGPPIQFRVRADFRSDLNFLKGDCYE